MKPMKYGWAGTNRPDFQAVNPLNPSCVAYSERQGEEHRRTRIEHLSESRLTELFNRPQKVDIVHI